MPWDYPLMDATISPGPSISILFVIGKCRFLVRSGRTWAELGYRSPRIWERHSMPQALKRLPPLSSVCRRSHQRNMSKCDICSKRYRSRLLTAGKPSTNGIDNTDIARKNWTRERKRPSSLSDRRVSPANRPRNWIWGEGKEPTQWFRFPAKMDRLQNLY